MNYTTRHHAAVNALSIAQQMNNPPKVLSWSGAAVVDASATLADIESQPGFDWGSEHTRNWDEVCFEIGAYIERHKHAPKRRTILAYIG